MTLPQIFRKFPGCAGLHSIATEGRANYRMTGRILATSVGRQRPSWGQVILDRVEADVCRVWAGVGLTRPKFGPRSAEFGPIPTVFGPKSTILNRRQRFPCAVALSSLMSASFQCVFAPRRRSLAPASVLAILRRYDQSDPGFHIRGRATLSRRISSTHTHIDPSAHSFDPAVSLDGRHWPVVFASACFSSCLTNSGVGALNRLG